MVFKCHIKGHQQEAAKEAELDDGDATPQPETPESDDSADVVSTDFRSLSSMADHWPWSSVLVKTIWLGIFLVIFQVGIGKVVTLFLSWLNEKLNGYSLGVVTLLFVIIGLLMFLLPPVPGVPVYVSGGIIITNSAWKVMDFSLALLYSSVICWLIKLLAIFCQQKLIGEGLGNAVAIRAMVGVNSPAIRAIKLILEEPGIKMGKVCILCGGPDWPTSVLTGILKLSVVEMLFASMPVFFLIMPCVASGALLLRASEGAKWVSAGSLALTGASMMQGSAALLAVYFIQQVLNHRIDEINAMENDEEVEKLDKATAEKNAAYLRVTDWHAANFPKFWKGLLFIGMLSMATCCYIFFFFSSSCFVPFKVTDSIGVTFGGNPVNIIRTNGWVAMGFCVFSYLCLIIFNRMATSKAARSKGPAPGKAIASNRSIEVKGTKKIIM